MASPGRLQTSRCASAHEQGVDGRLGGAGGDGHGGGWRRGLRLHSSLIGLEALRSLTQERTQGWVAGSGGGGQRRVGGTPVGVSSLILCADLLPSVIQEKYTYHRPSSLCAPASGWGHYKLQAQDTPGNKDALLRKLLYTLPRGKVAQGCVGRLVGKCLVMLGAGYTVFPKHGGLGRLTQGLPCLPLEKGQREGPKVSTSPP